MLRYTFAVIAASIIYALAIYGALNKQPSVNCCTAASHIAFGIAK